MKKILLLACLVLLVGCASSYSQVVKVEEAQADDLIMTERNNFSDEAVVIFDKFIRNNHDRIKKPDVQLELYEIIMKEVRFPRGRIMAIEQAESIYKRINHGLEVIIADYWKMRDDTQNSDRIEELDNTFWQARYLKGKNFYYWGVLYDKGSENRKKYLQEAIKMFNTLTLNY